MASVMQPLKPESRGSVNQSRQDCWARSDAGESEAAVDRIGERVDGDRDRAGVGEDVRRRAAGAAVADRHLADADEDRGRRGGGAGGQRHGVRHHVDLAGVGQGVEVVPAKAAIWPTPI